MTYHTFTRRRFLGTTAAAAAVAGLAPYATIIRAQDKKILNARLDSDISVLDPAYMVGAAEIDVQFAVLPRLVVYTNEGGKLDWTPSEYVESISQRDPTHIDFTLKPGFQWSNGFGELTAADVKYSFERMTTGDWSGYWEALKEVELKDQYSGTLVLKEPFAPLWLTTLASGSGTILCQKAVEQAGGKFTTEIPATCGPYTYKWLPKQRIVFTADPAWIGAKPDFDVVNYILVDEDKAAELAYEAGEVDITEITPSTVARYREQMPPDSKMIRAGALQYAWLGMNTEHPKLQDIRVRQAIQHAIDADSILQGAYSGTTERSFGIVPPGLAGKRNTSKYSYDPAKAKALLDEAGVSGLQIDLRTLNLQDRVLAAQIIQANLAAVGIQVKIIPLDSGPFWDMGQESKGETWKDLELWIMRFGAGPDPYEPFQWFVKEQIGIWNWERWSDPEFEALYQQGLTETDALKRSEIYLRMQEIMEDTGAYVWITHEPETFVHRTSIAPALDVQANMRFPEFKAV